MPQKHIIQKSKRELIEGGSYKKVKVYIRELLYKNINHLHKKLIYKKMLKNDWNKLIFKNTVNILKMKSI